MSEKQNPTTFADYMQSLDGKKVDIYIHGAPAAVTGWTVKVHGDYLTSADGMGAIPFKYIMRVRMSD